jgi:hypothetical protein
MFQGVKPFDWLMLGIEGLVLLVIVYEVIADARRRRADAKHRAFIDGKVSSLLQLADNGRRLQSCVPDCTITSDHRRIHQWMADVETWTEQTNSTLSGSLKATEHFMKLADTDKVSTWVDVSGRGFYVIDEPATPYRGLIVRLEALSRIVSTPEAYF